MFTCELNRKSLNQFTPSETEILSHECENNNLEKN